MPTEQPGGFGTRLAIKIANDTMAEIIAERFNWKWNRVIGQFFYTNSYQQDYPMLGISDIGWLEDCDKVDINNTAMPKPTNIPGITVVKQLSRTSLATCPVSRICWMYNQDLSLGTWPGPGITYHPLVTAVVQQNPLMSMKDSNGNILIVTTFGTTGSSAPAAATNAPEGTTVNDGSVVWTVVAPMSQGFRVDYLPGATGPVYQIIPYYQRLLQKLLTLDSVINPIPGDFDYAFQVGVEIKCKQASNNPALRAEAMKEYPLWLQSLVAIKKQANREPDAYSALPADSPVETTWGQRGGLRNPQDPSQPY